ncbi:diaminopimelate decarboxylase [Curtobacterium sp. SORGH_AS776]|nr:diaminopimelate decarboxylase [Curtobacterium sp. SORGH_AS_0776]
MSENPLAPQHLRFPTDASALTARIWPASATRTDDGELVVGGIAASDLVAQFGTPLYVVDERDVQSRAVRVRNAFTEAFERIGTRAHVYYAGKAFLTTQVAAWMVEADLRVDVCTGGELAVALAGGVDPALLGFHGNDKSDAEIARAVEVGVGTIVLDSHEEVQRVARAAADAGVVQRVRIRINSGVHASTHEYLATAREDQKFGIPLTEAVTAAEAVRAEPSLAFVGLHSHIGSQIFDESGFREAARRLMDVHASLVATGPVPELNLGGGWGIDYTEADSAFEPEDVADALATIVAEACAERDIPGPRDRGRARPVHRRARGDHALPRRHHQARDALGRRAGGRHPDVRVGRRRHERQRPTRALRRRLHGPARPDVRRPRRPHPRGREALRVRRHRRERRVPAR